MTANRFTLSEVDGQHSVAVQIPGGVLTLKFPESMPVAQAEEIAAFLNATIEEVAYRKSENMQPDLERLNEEQPVSVAVKHP